ncbi:MAG TPA: Hpt domain-containing protein [Terriglobales bacterium]|nr:Hpt domain-containing protein [Terriglobales bacterium]
MSRKDKVGKRLDVLWLKYLPAIRSRLEAINEVVEAIQRGEVTNELRATAAQEAHKLAGSLGTFGLQGSSDLALNVERLVLQAAQNSDTVAELREQLARLEQEVAQR